MNQRTIARVASLIPAGILGIAAFALVLEITDPPGPGLDPDALSYLGAAESVVAHGTYRIPTAKWASADSTAPLEHFPPGFSTALALPVRFGMTPPQAARLVEALCAAVTVTVLVLLVSAATTPLAGILLAVALFATPAMYEVHVSVLSEPLFLACLTLVLAAMTCAPDRPLRAGIPAALGALTRYAGMSCVGAVALWSLLQRAPLAMRMRRTVVAVLPALVLQGAWVLRTRHAAGPTAIRKFSVYTTGLGATLAQGARTLGAWLVPDPDAALEPLSHHGLLAVAAAVVVLLAVGGGVRRAWMDRATATDDRQRPAVDPQRLLGASAVLLACYLALIFVSRLLADPGIPFDNRLLAPALLLVTTIVATALALWWRAAHMEIARIAVCGALLGWLAASASVTAVADRYVRTWGSDFAGEQWRRSELLAWARTNGASVPLYSTWPAAVYFHLHRPARQVPLMTDDARALAAFPDSLRVHGGRLLVFDVADPQHVAPATLLASPGLRVVARVQDGVVLAASDLPARRPAAAPPSR
ncbi:MAG TPA: hypothetical protein VFN38_00500 [Gemmatimonadaceae bacterium]|nr:hypothetical protein [Gemmatimonadaceae bacterium]